MIASESVFYCKSFGAKYKRNEMKWRRFNDDDGRINVIAIEANVWNVNVAYWAVFYYFEISPK